MAQIGQFGVPIGKTRLVSSVIVAFPIGFFIFLGTTNLHWFTLTRQIYLLFGITAGLLLGVFETRIVIPKLANNMETIVWQIVPIGTALFGIPLLLAVAVFGVSEFSPFGLYAFFPAIPALLAASGWYFDKFEKANKVNVFVFYYGWKYWKEPNPDVSDRFYYFIRELVSKDYSLLYWHVGYSNSYIKELERKEGIDPSAKQELQRILKVMKRYRRVLLSVFGEFMVSMPLLVFWLFILTSTHTFGLQQVVAGKIVSGREITLLLGCTPVVAVFVGNLTAIWYLRKKFQRTISNLLASTDTNKLSAI